jgi:HEAT repeat protein
MTALVILASLSAVPAEAGRPVLPLTEWIADLGSADRNKQQAAYDGLRNAGPKAKGVVPLLVKALDAKNVPTSYVADILGAIGPAARDAVPALLARLPKEGDWGADAESIAFAVARIDVPQIDATRALLVTHDKGGRIALLSSQTLQLYPGQVVPHVVGFCADRSAKVRERAATVLGALGKIMSRQDPTKRLFDAAGDATKGIAPALEKLLADESTAVRLAAAGAIVHVALPLVDRALAVVVAIVVDEAGKNNEIPRTWDIFRPVPEPGAKVLIPLFDHPNDRVREWAISHLKSLAVRAPIEGALRDGKTARIRQAAALTIGERFSDGLDSAPALEAALLDPEFRVRFAAAVALVRVGANGSAWHRAAVPVLTEGLGHLSEPVRVDASHNLLWIGPTAAVAVPDLKKVLDDPRPAVRIEAALALVRIDVKRAAGTVPALIEGLKAGELPARRAAEALAELGPVARAAVPELVKHFGATSPHLRLYAAEAAARIDPTQAPKAVEVLVGLLQNPKFVSSMIRSYSLGALQRIGPPAKSALPALAELLTDDGPFHRYVALAMIAIDPVDTNPAFKWVRTEMLNTTDDGDAYELAERLPALGANGKSLVPDLVALLKSEKASVRESAAALLAAIGRDARDALPTLKKLAENDPRQNIRNLAAEVIKRIEAK